jgi:small subunit ribosomal protein S5
MDKRSTHRSRDKGRERGRTRRDEIKAPEVVWKPTTVLGKLVNEGKITDIEDVFNSGYTILEPEIVDTLIPDLKEDLLLIGQAKGKFGGGQRRIFRQTQKKTKEGNKIKFTTCAIVGNKNGYVGVAVGKSKETVPARDKAKRRAKLSLMRIRRGCGSWETDAREANSIPFAVEGKCGSVRLRLIPAPRGKGLCVEKECAKVLELAGIKDILSKTKGQTKTKLNLIYALLDALKKLSEVKIKSEDLSKLGVVDGSLKTEKKEEEKILTPEEIFSENEVENSVEVTETELDETELENVEEESTVEVQEQPEKVEAQE